MMAENFMFSRNSLRKKIKCKLISRNISVSSLIQNEICLLFLDQIVQVIVKPELNCEHLLYFGLKSLKKVWER